MILDMMALWQQQGQVFLLAKNMLKKKLLEHVWALIQ